MQLQSTVRLALVLSALLAVTPAFAQIEVRSAVYGANCGRASNVTWHPARICNGRDRCRYEIDHQQIGDPAIGCYKDFRIGWSCRGQAPNYTIVSGEASGKTVFLRCD